MKKVKNTNLLFAIALLIGLLVHLYFVFIVPFSDDESYYASVPFRLLNGDSLIQHEWHLTQFSSLFAFLPVYIWNAIKGSADGIFVFLRCTYLVIHTAIAVVIYRFFKKYGIWAVMASMMFYVQIAYRIQGISYHSAFAVFLLLLSLCLLSIHNNGKIRYYIFAGICFGCCCVCNPFLCFAFALYLLACILWTQRETLKDAVIRHKSRNITKGKKKLTKKQKRQQKQFDTFVDMESYTCFFNKKAILLFSCGIIISAIVAVTFFFSTGGSISIITKNIDSLLSSSEYDVTSNPFLSKLIETVVLFSKTNLGMPWILPAIFVALAFDKKRKLNSHRFAYLAISLVWAVIFIFAFVKTLDINAAAVSLPFWVFSTICYILTTKKNKPVFYCMYVPCMIAAVFHYLAANTHLAAIGIVFAISNVAGVVFIMDLWNEIRDELQKDSEATKQKSFYGLCRGIIIVGFCMQLLFYGIFYQLGQYQGKDAVAPSTGPYSGLYMTEARCNSYNKLINDLDKIKAISSEESPVLLVSYNNWMYLYLERPVATYTTWYMGGLTFDTELLAKYYDKNPKKIPEYIYIEASDPYGQSAQIMTDIVSEIFEFEKEELSYGVLLTVTDCKF